MYINPNDFAKLLSKQELFWDDQDNARNEAYLLCSKIKNNEKSTFIDYEKHFLQLLNQETFFFSRNKTIDIIKFLFPKENAYQKLNELKELLLNEVEASPNFLNKEAFSQFMASNSYELYEKVHFIEKNDLKIENHHWLCLFQTLIKNPNSNFDYDELSNLKSYSKFKFSELKFDDKTNPYGHILTTYNIGLKVNDKIRAIKSLHKIGIPLSDPKLKEDVIFKAIHCEAGDKILDTLLLLTNEIKFKNFIYYLIYNTDYNSRIMQRFFKKTTFSEEDLHRCQHNDKPNWLTLIINTNTIKHRRFSEQSATMLINFLDKLSHTNSENKTITLRSKLEGLNNDLVNSIIVEYDRKSILNSLNEQSINLKEISHKKRL